MSEATFELLCAHQRETALLHSVAELLEWDERTMMPSGAGRYRAEQVAYMSGLVHKRRTEPRVGEWLSELEGGPLARDPHSDAGATIRQLRRAYDKLVKVPATLVEELTRTAVLGQQTWVEARKHDDFRSFAPVLEKIIRLKRQQAEAVGYSRCAYDALLDDYEPGATTAEIARVLGEFREELVLLVAAVAQSGRSPDLTILRRHYPQAAQERFGQMAATTVGFDFQRGRLDVTHHPFCCELGPDDCRITTRYDEHFFPSAFFGILHEAGHGLYDQGLRKEQYGLPPGSFVSLGIHESQSRMWENFVGRSAPFWQYFFPQAQQAFPLALSDVSREQFYFAINDVRPSLIRVEADEATYNLHIIVRFELEQALINDHCPVGDLPGAWRSKYREYLGIEPPGDADGVLQDVHWSAGLFGYFPTYSLGNLYAAQFFEQADRELGGLEAPIAQGDFRGLLGWLRDKIHTPGQCYTAGELVQAVTGRPLSPGPLLHYLRRKFHDLYELDGE
ncbi:MAG: carboxypeptidase M32 [Pirellulaceae bacterium]